jgi:hypothetical protein
MTASEHLTRLEQQIERLIDERDYVTCSEFRIGAIALLREVEDALPALAAVVAAAETYREASDRYRRLLEDVTDGRRVRGFDKAKAAHDKAADAYDAADSELRRVLGDNQ